MPVSQTTLNNAKTTGASGGTVSTTGMSHQDKAEVDKAVNDGRNGK